jgi:hypothetical protein
MPVLNEVEYFQSLHVAQHCHGSLFIHHKKAFWEVLAKE